MSTSHVPFYRLPGHIRDSLIKDPMHLQRRHNQAVADFRLTTGADVWVPSSRNIV